MQCQGADKLLQKVDAYGAPVKLENNRAYRTAGGGVLSLAAILLCGSSVIYKIAAESETSASAPINAFRRLQDIKVEGSEANIATSTSTSGDNFILWDQQEKSLDSDNYDGPISMKDSGWGVYITLIRDELRRKQLKEIAQSAAPLSLFSKYSKSVYGDFTTAVAAGGDYIRIKVTNHFLPGRNTT